MQEMDFNYLLSVSCTLAAEEAMAAWVEVVTVGDIAVVVVVVDTAVAEGDIAAAAASVGMVGGTLVVGVPREPVAS